MILCSSTYLILITDANDEKVWLYYLVKAQEYPGLNSLTVLKRRIFQRQIYIKIDR